MQTGNWQQALERFQQGVVDLLFGYLPNLLGALLVFLVGWLLAAVVSRLVRGVLERLGVQKLLGGGGGLPLFEQTTLRLDAPRLSGQITYWFLLITALLLAAETANLPQVEQFLVGLFAYVPQVFSALVVVALTLGFGGLVRRVVAASLPPGYSYVGSAVQALLYGLGTLAALAELGIARTPIYILFGGIVGFAMVSGGIAFGLGGRDAAREIIDVLRRPQDE
jgi:small-conductance mechanosensitive channel